MSEPGGDSIPAGAEIVRLPDGRALGFATYGDPAGAPVLSFHGGLSSRLDAAYADATCRELGVRLVAPDRPGIGRSDPQPGRTLLDWPADVAALAAALGLERFGVMGWSAGGPYAAACAHAFPERLTGTAMASSSAPFDLIGTRRDLNRPDRILSTLSCHAPPLAAAVLELSIKRRSPEAVLRGTMRFGSESDRAVLRAAGPPQEATAFAFEALRQGTGGVITDYRVMVAPWGFPLEDVEAPVEVWHGGADPACPPRYGHLLAERLPQGRLHLCPGEGHFLLRTRCREIMEGLRG